MPALKGKDIPPGNWVRPQPAGTKLCRACGYVLAPVLVEWGEEYHVTCGPDRRPMTLKVIPHA